MLNLLRDNLGARKKSKSLGRGIGSGKGKTAGRGGKGQTARTGVALNGFEGGQTPIHRRLPKRGFNSLNKKYYHVINLADIQVALDSGVISSEKLDREAFEKMGMIKGRASLIKLLGKGELKSKVDRIVINAVSASARVAIENLGGVIDIVKE